MSDSKDRLLNNRYLIIKQIGKGASGRVYLAKDTKQKTADNLRALKELSPSTKDLEIYKILCERFEAEVKYLHLLNGFNGQIPILYNDFLEKNDSGGETRYMVQEYIEGKTLREKISKEGPLNKYKVKEILLSLLPVIAHIHDSGFIHRDIDPTNIILREQDQMPVLIDFGAVKDAEATIVRSGEINSKTITIGKDGYMAPEHFNGTPGFASDLYSLGMTAIELLSGLHPKTVNQDSSAFKMSWPDRVPGISRDFVAVLNKAIETDLSSRYENAQSMFKALISATAIETIHKDGQVSGRKLFSEAKRPPKPLAKKYIKCWDTLCDFFLDLYDEYCVNCGAYNKYWFNNNDFHLMHNSAQEHLDRIYPHYSQSKIINWAKDIENSDETFFVGIVVGCTLLGAIIGWFLGEGFFGTIGSFIGYGILGLIGGGLLVGILLLSSIIGLSKYKKLLRDLDEEKKTLERRLQKNTRKYRESSFYLRGIEKDITENIKDISSHRSGIERRLFSTQTAVKEKLLDLKKDEKDLRQVLIKLDHKLNKYKIKLLEINLLRLYNKLQMKTSNNSMNGTTRSEVEEELKGINRLVENLSDVLNLATQINLDDDEVWIKYCAARFLEAKKILPKLLIPLIRQINYLVEKKRHNETLAPPKEFILNFAFLNAYITYDDFYKEYQALQSE